MNAEQLQAVIDQVAGECIAVRMRMLNRVITNIYDDALRPLVGTQNRSCHHPLETSADDHDRSNGLHAQAVAEWGP